VVNILDRDRGDVGKYPSWRAPTHPLRDFGSAALGKTRGDGEMIMLCIKMFCKILFPGCHLKQKIYVSLDQLHRKITSLSIESVVVINCIIGNPVFRKMLAGLKILAGLKNYKNFEI
jgi:hypothetical protein